MELKPTSQHYLEINDKRHLITKILKIILKIILNFKLKYKHEKKVLYTKRNKTNRKFILFIKNLISNSPYKFPNYNTVEKRLYTEDLLNKVIIKYCKINMLDVYLLKKGEKIN